MENGDIYVVCGEPAYEHKGESPDGVDLYECTVCGHIKGDSGY